METIVKSLHETKRSYKILGKKFLLKALLKSTSEKLWIPNRLIHLIMIMWYNVSSRKSARNVFWI